MLELENRLVKALNPLYTKPDTYLDEANYSAYNKFVEDNHSQAISVIVNHFSNKISTKNKCINILNTHHTMTDKYGIIFDYIIFEVFDRKIKPNYEPDFSGFCDIKYNTWEATVEDISTQKSKGIKGKVFIVFPSVEKINKQVTVLYKITDDGEVKLARNNKGASIYKGKLKGLYDFGIHDYKILNEDELAMILNNLNSLKLYRATHATPKVGEVLNRLKESLVL